MGDSFKASFSHYLPDPKNVHFQGEDNGEKILLLLRRHIITNVGWVLVATALLVIPFVLPVVLAFGGLNLFLFIPYNFGFVLLLFWYLFVATFIFESYLVWYSNVYIVTNKRLVDVDFHGILHIRVTEAPLTNIEDVTYSISGLVPTLFNFGHIQIQTAGEVQGIEFESIPYPAIVHDKVSDLATGVRNASRH